MPSGTEAFQKIFLARSASQSFQNNTTLCVIGLARGIPFGALQGVQEIIDAGLNLAVLFWKTPRFAAQGFHFAGVLHNFLDLG